MLNINTLLSLSSKLSQLNSNYQMNKRKLMSDNIYDHVKNPADILRLSRNEAQIRSNVVKQQAMQHANLILDVRQSALSNVYELSNKLNELSKQYQNSSSEEDKKAISEESLNLLKEMSNTFKNTTVDGKSVFSKEQSEIKVGDSTINISTPTVKLPIKKEEPQPSKTTENEVAPKVQENLITQKNTDELNKISPESIMKPALFSLSRMSAPIQEDTMKISNEASSLQVNKTGITNEKDIVKIAPMNVELKQITTLQHDEKDSSPKKQDTKSMEIHDQSSKNLSIQPHKDKNQDVEKITIDVDLENGVKGELEITINHHGNQKVNHEQEKKNTNSTDHSDNVSKNEPKDLSHSHSDDVSRNDSKHSDNEQKTSDSAHKNEDSSKKNDSKQLNNHENTDKHNENHSKEHNNNHETPPVNPPSSHHQPTHKPDKNPSHEHKPSTNPIPDNKPNNDHKPDPNPIPGDKPSDVHKPKPNPDDKPKPTQPPNNIPLNEFQFSDLDNLSMDNVRKILDSGMIEDSFIKPISQSMANNEFQKELNSSRIDYVGNINEQLTAYQENYDDQQKMELLIKTTKQEMLQNVVQTLMVQQLNDSRDNIIKLLYS